MTLNITFRSNGELKGVVPINLRDIDMRTDDDGRISLSKEGLEILASRCGHVYDAFLDNRTLCAPSCEAKLVL
jgi:hypothetical protein